MLLGFAPLTSLRKTSTSLRFAQDDRLSCYVVLFLTYPSICHPERRKQLSVVFVVEPDHREGRAKREDLETGFCMLVSVK